MVLKEHGGPLTDKQRKMLEEAERSCARIGALVAEMSDLGKLESKELAVARQDVDMAALVVELASAMHEGEDRGVHLDVRVPNRPITVTGDRGRLSAAITTLLHAALRERGEPGVIVAECAVMADTAPAWAILTVGTDTNVETTPGRGTNGFQGVAINQVVVVEPSSLHGWVDFDDLPGTGTGSGGFVDGPGTAPLGAGSAFLTVDALGRHALGTTAYIGTRMDDITELKYWSYQNNNINTAAAISLQFDIDYDLNDGVSSYMGRLVFEPYLTPTNTVQQGVWQNWDALAGKWWGTRTTVTVNGVPGVAQPCQQGTPCTWAQVLSSFPNAGIGNTQFTLYFDPATEEVWDYVGGVADIRENATYRATTRFVTGDVLRISVDGGVVTYRKNGALVYTSKLSVPTQPMRALASLYTKPSTVTLVTISSSN
jgi:hypothetical protein